MSTPPITRIGLVRHGETDWNVEGRLQGWTDIPLNATGHAQAQALARQLAQHHLGPQASAGRIDRLISSPLQRAHATARHLGEALGLPVQTDARLRERQLGALQGITREEVQRLHPAVHSRLLARRPDHQAPGAEPYPTLVARVSEALSDWAGRHPGETLLLVAHGGVLDAAHRWVQGIAPETPREHALPNTVLQWYAVVDGRWRLEAAAAPDSLPPPGARDDRGG